MSTKEIIKTAKLIRFFRDTLHMAVVSFSACLTADYEEVYIAFFVSGDGTKDTLLAATLMKSPERLVFP